MMSRLSKSLVAVGVVAATVMAGTAPAFADNSGTLPSGCSISPSAPSIYTYNGARLITYGGTAVCKSASYGEGRLVHNYDGLPDKVVNKNGYSNNGTGQWTLNGSTCDNGGTTQYYSELALTVSGSPQRVSKTVTLTHC